MRKFSELKKKLFITNLEREALRRVKEKEKRES